MGNLVKLGHDRDRAVQLFLSRLNKMSVMCYYFRSRSVPCYGLSKQLLEPTLHLTSQCTPKRLRFMGLHSYLNKLYYMIL